MGIQLIDNKNNKVNAEIQKADVCDIKNLMDWKFNWHELARTENSNIYKLQSQKIEGLLMIQFIEAEFFEMKNIEVAPSNLGSRGKFINVAQLMIAYACLLSFELNKGPYQGYLSFISRGELIDYYIDKYNAELVFRERMIINPINGIKLIKQHLNIDL